MYICHSRCKVTTKNPKNNGFQILWQHVADSCSGCLGCICSKGAFLAVILHPKGKAMDGIKAYKGILKEFIQVNPDKTISLTRCCAVSGLGPGPGPYVKKPNFKRDGSFDYYMSEPIRDNDAKGVGPFIWASLEMEMQGLNK